MQQVNLFLELLILLLGDIKKEKIMAFDPTLPATGVTKFGDLYAILRANFVGLGTPEAWTDFTPGTGWTVGAQCSYMKDPFGFVHFKGYIWHTVGTVSQIIYTITDVNYRPDQRFYNGRENSASAAGWTTFEILTNGEIVSSAAYYNGSGTIYLDGITYKAAVV